MPTWLYLTLTFDGGYITIDPSFTVEVSKRLHDDFGNGRDYYSYHGKKLQIIPEQAIQLPSREFLDWHNTHTKIAIALPICMTLQLDPAAFATKNKKGT